MGTSLTAGNYENRFWQPQLAALLETKTSHPITVRNFGIGGGTSANGLASIGSFLPARPEILTIEYSMNDSGGSLTLAQSRANAISIINQFRAQDPDIMIYMLVMTPIVPGTGGFIARPNLVWYYDVYRQMAADPSLNVGLIDNYLDWPQPPTTGLLPDGLHPLIADMNQRLVPRIATVLAPAITARFG